MGFLAALPYLHGIGNSFIEFDDPEYVTRNIHVLKGLTWDGLGWALTTFHQGNWHPLTWLSHMAVVSLCGIDPRGHHLANILLHSLNAALLYVALARLTGAPGSSAFVAALFGVHPFHVESVAWVAERKDLLAGLFFMLVLLAYERYVRRGTAVRLAAVAAFLALGLAAKPMLVTVPLVLLLLDLWPLGRTCWKKLLLEKTPLLALVLISSVVTFLAQREGGAVVDLESLPLEIRLPNAVVAYAVYLVKTVWPSHLVLYYPIAEHPWWQIIGSMLLLAALSWAALVRFRRAPYLAVGWFWFAGMLVPVIGVIQVGGQAFADRYTYLPLVGLFIAAAWGVPGLLPARWNRAAVLGIASGAVVVVLVAVSWVQVGYWKDSQTIFRRTLSFTSGNWLMKNNLGTALIDAGKIDEAMVQFREDILLRPDYPNAHYNLGVVLSARGRQEEALAEIREALRLQPDFPEARDTLGNMLAALGKSDEAAIQLREALRFKPDYPEARNDLGNLLLGAGKLDEAMTHYREALRLKPDYPEAHVNLGNILARLNKPDEAVLHYREAIRLRPDFPEAHGNLGNALVPLGLQEEAVVHYREAIRLRPEFVEAHYNLGNLLAARGNVEEAIDQFSAVLRIRPDLAEAHERLAILLKQRGRMEEARRHVEEAQRLRGSGSAP